MVRLFVRANNSIYLFVRLF